MKLPILVYTTNDDTANRCLMNELNLRIAKTWLPENEDIESYIDDEVDSIAGKRVASGVFEGLVHPDLVVAIFKYGVAWGRKIK